MSNLEVSLNEILAQEPDRRVAAARIAQIIDKAMLLLAQRHQAEVAELAGVRQLLDLFFHQSGRTAGILEGISFIDGGLEGHELRATLATQARKYYGDMTHYHTMMKVMR